MTLTATPVETSDFLPVRRYGDPPGLDSAGLKRALTEMWLEGKSAKTMIEYAKNLEDFRKFLGVETVGKVAEMLLSSHGYAHELALSYRADMLNRGLSPVTANCRISTLRSLVDYANIIGLVFWQLRIKNLSTEPYRDTRGCGTDGFRRLLTAASGDNPKAIRDRSILRLMFDLALRREEIARLNIGDLDLDSGTIAVLGKGRREKELMTLPAPTIEALRCWLDFRGYSPGPLYMGLHRNREDLTQRLSGSGINKMIHKYARRAGIKNCHAHSLRHASITQASISTGGNIPLVMKHSRHKNPQTVMIYIANIEDAQGKVAAMVAAFA